jgi:prevent-host-death family protein
MGVHVGVRELRDHLSRWLEKVKQGEEVIVTERGRPVAKIASVDLPSQYQRLIDAGLIEPSEKPKRKSIKPVTGQGTVSDLLDRWR